MPHRTMAVPITVPVGYPERSDPSGQWSRRRSMKIRTRNTEKSSGAWKIGTGSRRPACPA